MLFKIKKNNSILLLVLFLQYAINSFGQERWPDIFVEAKVKKQYYAGENLSQEYALIGMYKQSLAEDDRVKGSDDTRHIRNDSTIEAKNAYPYIYDAIKNNDVVILNECHNIPLHRALLYTLADSFITLGVQGVFLETLGYVPDDSAYIANHPNQPIGYYTFENVYNQVLRKMQQKHIKLYSYENSFNKLDTTTIANKKYIFSPENTSWAMVEADSFIISQLYSSDAFVARDAEQAIHIYQKLVAHKIQKAFIYCGYDHVLKSQGYMAGMLQHLLHKKVFSIDQTLLNECSEKKFENPLYVKFAGTDYPFVLLYKRRQPFHTFYFPNDNKITDSLVDMLIGSPRTVYKNNRPTWLELNGDRKRYPLSAFIDVGIYTEDFLVVIYDVVEYGEAKLKATPLDVFQVEKDAALHDVILTPHKKYHLFGYRNEEIIIDKIIEAL